MKIFGHLIEHAGIARSGWVVEAEEAESADAVADRHDDDVVVICKNLPVVQVQRRRAAVESAAVDPDHHRRSTSAIRHPDVQVQTVLAHLPRRVPHV